jgi:hypothetical protein
MSYRTAAAAAYLFACDKEVGVAKLGMQLLSDLAEKQCYLAMLNMVHLHTIGVPGEQNLALARTWAIRAQLLHPTLTDADDLCDAGSVCDQYAYWLNTTERDALSFWERAASLGSGRALWQICEKTRADKGTQAWFDRIEIAAALGSSDAMLELAECDGVRDTEQELIWLRAAAALGSLRAEEMLKY